MAKAEFIRPVEALHGKLKKSDKVGFAKRKDSGAKFTVTRDDWRMKYKTAQTQTEAEARQLKFKSVAGNTRDRMTDPTKRTVDYANFKAQSKYKTFWGYLFHLEWESYEA